MSLMIIPREIHEGSLVYSPSCKAEKRWRTSALIHPECLISQSENTTFLKHMLLQISSPLSSITVMNYTIMQLINYDLIAS